MPMSIGVPKITLRSSEVADLDDCRRRYLWSRRYTSEREFPGLYTGSFGHKGLEIYYRNHRDPESVVDHWPRESMKLYEEIREENPRVSIDTVWSCKETAYEYIKYYMQYDQAFPLRGEIYGVERRLSMPLLHPDTKEPHPRLQLSGKVDLALDQDGIPTIVDHKFFGEYTYMKLGQLENTILVDAQLTSYSYLWYRETGVVPKKVILNLILKKKPEMPPLLSRGGLSKARSLSTTGLLYRQAVEENGLEITEYQDIIDHYDSLGYKQYFVRIESTRNLKQLLAYERMLWYKGQVVAEILADSTMAYPSASIYRCGDCPFVSPCAEADRGGDPDSYLETLPKVDPDASM